jgi:hypothetical protein
MCLGVFVAFLILILDMLMTRLVQCMILWHGNVIDDVGLRHNSS